MAVSNETSNLNEKCNESIDWLHQVKTTTTTSSNSSVTSSSQIEIKKDAVEILDKYHNPIQSSAWDPQRILKDRGEEQTFAERKMDVKISMDLLKSMTDPVNEWIPLIFRGILKHPAGYLKKSDRSQTGDLYWWKKLRELAKYHRIL